ncbi:MAG: sulfatase [Cyclobacteriaceae bacterium]
MICLVLSVLILGSCKKEEIQRPNILWINSDDLGPELACYGNPDVTTPHIDQLAAEGVRFTKAYSNSPVCSSSRSSLITGMYPPSVNSHDHRTINMTDLPEGIKPITEYFRKAGYFVSLGDAKDMSKMGKADYNFLNKKMYDGPDWSGRAKGQPFFAQVHIKYPHRTFEEHVKNPVDPNNVALPACYPDHPLLRADWALYLESVQHCDDYVGKILKRLEDESLADNTIVFFFGDHGRPHLRDKQFLYEGGIKIPLIVRWPQKLKPKVDGQLVSLVDVAATSLNLAGIKLPEHLQGQVFLGEKANEREYVYAFRDRAGNAVDNIRSITDGRHKLIWNRMASTPYMQLSSYKKAQYPAFTLYKVLHARGQLQKPFNLFMAEKRPEIELYDLGKDPMEAHNLADNPAYSDIKKELFDNLKDRMPAFEKNMVPETSETTAKAKQGSYNYYVSLMEKRGLDPDISDEDYLKYWEKRLLNQN